MSLLDSLKSIEVRVAEGVAWVTLNRPVVLNTISTEMLSDLRSAFTALQQDVSIRVVIMTGAGRAFCAGADLAGLNLKDGGAALAEFLAEVRKTFDLMRAFPRPVIAAVNGIAAGGGLELALCCDFIVAHVGARFSDAHANIGAIPGGGSSALLPRLVGAAYAKYMIFSGEAVPASELHRLGLVVKVCAPEELMETVSHMAARLAANSTVGLATMKALIDKGLESQSLRDALDEELAANRRHVATGDFSEGVDAFQSKRKPIFNRSTT